MTNSVYKGMQNLSYSTKLQFNSEEDKRKLFAVLELERDIFNFCSEKHFGSKKNSIVELHAKCYKAARKKFPLAKAQIIVKAENSCLSSYKSAKGCKNKVTKPMCKRRLSINLDKHLYRYKDGLFYFTTLEKTRTRIVCSPATYHKWQELSSREGVKFCDPLLFVRNDEIYIRMSFKFELPLVKEGKLALGVDLGIRRLAATSEGKIFKDKKFLKEKRKLRYLRRCLYSKFIKGSRKARKHFKQLSRKETNRNRNFNHHLANKILQTKADTIVLEEINLKKLKGKKHRYQNKNRISQVAFGAIRTLLTYKAPLCGKQVVTVNPAFTSQDDSVTGHRDGIRKGCRYYAKSGLVYDADVNAAVNIARKSKLPISCKNVLDGQATVIRPLGNRLGDSQVH